MMLFGKKKEDKPLPIDEVRAMEGKGMSDKDIIKQLKHKGYSYKDIEKAMLESVKEGVGGEAQQMASMQSMAPTTDNTFQTDMPATGFELPTLDEAPQEEMPEQFEQTDIIIEELVEGIVEEKWQKFQERIGKIEESIDGISAQFRQYDTRMMQPQGIEAHDSNARVSDIADQLDDLDARVGGLEKAFKQFLPSLTRNIEALSHMIHEIKEKTGQVEMQEA